MVYTKFFSSRKGFTLIELSISFIVIALIIVGLMTMQTQDQNNAKRTELISKMDAIEKALYNYRVVNSKLPCPGDASIARTSANFGVQANGNPGECHLGSTISSNINSNDAGVSVFGGSVPVRTLGLSDDMAFDPWGRLFTYYIDKNANIAENFVCNEGTIGLVDTDLLNVQDESGTEVNESIIAVVLSHGPNGHGGFLASGSRMSSGSTNAAEQENCMCDASAAAVGDSDRLIRFQRMLPTSAASNRTMFDDIVRYYPKRYFYLASERTGS